MNTKGDVTTSDCNAEKVGAVGITSAESHSEVARREGRSVNRSKLLWRCEHTVAEQ